MKCKSKIGIYAFDHNFYYTDLTIIQPGAVSKVLGATKAQRHEEKNDFKIKT